MAKATPDDIARKNALSALVRQPSWKYVEAIMESQWLSAIADFRVAKKPEEFFKAQAMLNQVEGLFSQISGQVSCYGMTESKKITDLQDVLRQRQSV